MPTSAASLAGPDELLGVIERSAPGRLEAEAALVAARPLAVVAAWRGMRPEHLVAVRDSPARLPRSAALEEMRLALWLVARDADRPARPDEVAVLAQAGPLLVPSELAGSGCLSRVPVFARCAVAAGWKGNGPAARSLMALCRGAATVGLPPAAAVEWCRAGLEPVRDGAYRSDIESWWPRDPFGDTARARAVWAAGFAPFAAAGFSPEQTARLLALPEGHPNRPGQGELSLMAGLAAGSRS